MPEFTDHNIIIAIALVLLTLLIAIIIESIITYKLLKKMIEYHDNFANIHDAMDHKIERVISRQGKIGSIIGALLSETRGHYKVVMRALNELGVDTTPDKH